MLIRRQAAIHILLPADETLHSSEHKIATQPQEVCMFSASELAQLHFELLVKNNARWQSLLGQEIVWELVYAASLGHPTRLSGHAEVFRHAAWFAGAVDNFRFFDLRLYPLADADSCLRRWKVRERSKLPGCSTNRTTWC
jgi:hypothetical protein